MHHTALRALAYQWQRILWRCWRDGVPYDARYEAALIAKGSPLAAGIAALRSNPKTGQPNQEETVNNLRQNP